MRSRLARWIAITALAAVMVAGLGWGTLAWSNTRCWQVGPPLVCRVQAPSAGVVALSFDDGPTPEGVDAVLPVLEAHGARATFFLIGEEVERHPGDAARLVTAGMELGNHSWSHQRMVLKSGSFYDDEIARTQQVLAEAGEDAPVLFRPPNGKKLIGLPRAVERAGLTTVMWSVEDDLSGTLSAKEYAAQIVEQAEPGSIILMHVMYPGGQVAREALPLVLEGLDTKGLRAVTVSELLAAATD